MPEGRGLRTKEVTEWVRDERRWRVEDEHDTVDGPRGTGRGSRGVRKDRRRNSRKSRIDFGVEEGPREDRVRVGDLTRRCRGHSRTEPRDEDTVVTVTQAVRNGDLPFEGLPVLVLTKQM